MFGLLKEKLSNFIGRLVKKEEELAEAPAQMEKKQEEKPTPPEKTQAKKIEEKPAAAEKKTEEKPTPVAKEQPAVKKPEEKPKPAEKKAEGKPKPAGKEPPAVKKTEEKPVAKVEIQKQQFQVQKIEEKKQEEKKPFSFEISFFGKKQQPAEEKKKTETVQEEKPHIIEAKKPEEKMEAKQAEVLPSAPAHSAPSQPKRQEAERKMEVKIGWGEQIKSIFTGEVQIKEGDIRELLEELQMALLEADVAYEVSLAVCDGLKSQLVGMKIKRGEVSKAAKNAMQTSLESVLSSERAFDFVEKVRGLPKPAVILFVGPNGAGKTTTMAKLAKMLMGSGMSVVFSASDTFRAAAIEQTEVHGKRLGVHVIKNAYGSDPAAVAFDAVAYARSHKIDVVLVDSAGRQDTNVNLLDELKKMNRVAKPAMKIYIGESIAGNSIIDQIKAFNEAVGIDGVILTKLDCDAKGGTALSITYTTKIPIVFFGVGQKYEDLVRYSAHSLAEEILT